MQCLGLMLTGGWHAPPSRMLVCRLSATWWAALALAQNPRQIAVRTEVSKDAVPSCYDRVTGELAGSEIVRSPALVSPDHRFRAYTENEATAFGQSVQDDVPWLSERKS